MRLPTLALFCLLMGSSAADSNAADLETRYGRLTTDDQNLLIFRDVPVRPRVEGNNFLTFENKFEFPGYDLVLVQDVGGTACPAQYYVVKLSRDGAVATASFGTCTVLIAVKRTAKGIIVQMPGFFGPYEGRAAHARAAKQLFIYTYGSGKIIEQRLR